MPPLAEALEMGLRHCRTGHNNHETELTLKVVDRVFTYRRKTLAESTSILFFCNIMLTMLRVRHLLHMKISFTYKKIRCLHFIMRLSLSVAKCKLYVFPGQTLEESSDHNFTK